MLYTLSVVILVYFDSVSYPVAVEHDESPNPLLSLFTKGIIHNKKTIVSVITVLYLGILLGLEVLKHAVDYYRQHLRIQQNFALITRGRYISVTASSIV